MLNNLKSFEQYDNDPYSEENWEEKDKKWMNKKIIIADNGFFDMFPFPIVNGDKTNILKDKNSVAKSSSFFKF